MALPRRTVAITGAARGIRFATRAAANAGAQVVIGDLDTAALTAAEQIGPRAHPVFLDVTSRESFAAFLDTAAQQSDSNLDVLINNAGIQHIGALVDATGADVHRQIEVNVGGTLTGLQLALARMVPRAAATSSTYPPPRVAPRWRTTASTAPPRPRSSPSARPPTPKPAGRECRSASSCPASSTPTWPPAPTSPHGCG